MLLQRVINQALQVGGLQVGSNTTDTSNKTDSPAIIIDGDLGKQQLANHLYDLEIEPANFGEQGRIEISDWLMGK